MKRPTYWEDVDLSFQVRAAGRMIAQRPDFEVVHRGGSMTAKMKEGIPFQGENWPAAYLYERNRMRFLHKWKHMLHPRLDEAASRAFIAKWYKR